MAHIDDLKDSIQRHDPERFLADYLTLIVNGASLTLPRTIEKDAAKLQWRDVIPSVCGTPSEGFISDLTALWGELVQEHGGIVGKSVPQDLLDLLLKKVATQNIPKETRHDGNSIQRVTPSISNDYTKLQEAKKQPLRAKSDLVQACKQALLSDNEFQFLIAYLELNVQTKKNILPKTSISGKAYLWWDETIQEKFKQKMPDYFLEKLSGLWINAVAKKGLPTSDYHVSELFYHIKANYDLSKPKKQEAKPSQINRFIRFLRSS